MAVVYSSNTTDSTLVMGGGGGGGKIHAVPYSPYPPHYLQPSCDARILALEGRLVELEMVVAKLCAESARTVQSPAGASNPPLLRPEQKASFVIDDEVVAEALSLYLEHERMGRGDAMRRVLLLVREKL
jgi:hypothetical protein